MTTPSQNGFNQRSVIDASTVNEENRSGLDDYIANSNHELNALIDLASIGEMIDRPSRDWMLDQVDFIVEIIGNEDLELGDEMRSNLLQLLLGIANLNEQIRSQASLDF